MASKALGIFLGQCVPSVKANASKIRIKRMVLDTNLLMVITPKLGSSLYSFTKNVFFISVFQKG